jgi:hypothetical protein
MQSAEEAMRLMIDMAREAGMTGLEAGGLFDNFLVFEALVRADEREACAKVCDDINAKYKWPDDVAERVASQWCADAIRARGNT